MTDQGQGAAPIGSEKMIPICVKVPVGMLHQLECYRRRRGAKLSKAVRLLLAAALAQMEAMEQGRGV